ncbi:MAG TPA: amidase family protein [Acidimicrobiales bacterium]|nr:amidase family protein [Acidimicrobiales bacterium]
MDDLAYTDVFTLQAQHVPATELVPALLERLRMFDTAGSSTELRSVLAVSPTATEDAARSDREGGAARGRPLAGIPVLVKDNIEVAGMPSCAGSTSLVSRPALRDAPLVARLREAGAIVIGTTNLSEWANIRSPRSTSGWSAVGGLTGNPWALDRSAGGSSSGSGAAVAAGFAPLAIGTETDGSITCPCSLNGVAGIKPTVGFLSTAGVVPISRSQDSPGPMARTVEEVALLLEVLGSKQGILDRVREGGAGLKVGVARTWRTGHPPTDAVFDDTIKALRGIGIDTTDIDVAVPTDEVEGDELTVLLCELADGLAEYLPTRGPDGPQDLEQVIAYEDENASEELAHFGHEFFERALSLGGTSNDAYRSARAANLQWAVGQCLEPALATCDVLVAPAYGPAWKSDLTLGGHPAAASPVTTAAAIAGWPIATVPMGLVDGMPVGFSAVGRPSSESLLLSVCREVERAAGVVGQRPAWRQPARG